MYPTVPLPKSYGVTGMQMFYLAPALSRKTKALVHRWYCSEQQRHEKVLALFHSEIYLEDHTFHNGCPLGRIYIPEGGDCLRCAYLTAHYAVALGRQFFIPEGLFSFRCFPALMSRKGDPADPDDAPAVDEAAMAALSFSFLHVLPAIPDVFFLFCLELFRLFLKKLLVVFQILFQRLWKNSLSGAVQIFL